MPSLPGRIWNIIGAALIASALSDVLIVAAQTLGAGHWQPWIISIYSSGMLLIVGTPSLSDALVAGAADTDAPPEQCCRRALTPSPTSIANSCG